MPSTVPVLDYEAPRHDPYAALRQREFRLYCIGWLFATVGYQMQSVTIGWEVYQWTGSALQLGIVGGLQAVPLILLALPGGHLADILDRRRIAIVGASAAMVMSAGLMLVSLGVVRGWMPMPTALWLLYALVFTGGIINAFTRPARAALLPQLVPPKFFSNAVTWNSSIFEVSSMGGPAIAGVIIALFRPYTIFGLTAVFSLVFAGVLMLLGTRPAEKRAEAGRGPDDLLAGLRFVWRTKAILATITLDLFAVLLGGATYLLPVFAERLGVGPVGFGWMRAAPAIGAFSMAMFLAHRRPMRHAGRALLLAVAGFGAATIVFGLSQWFWVSMIALFLTGALDNISVVVRHTLVQLLTPDRMRGRVSAVNAVFIGASNELGGLESGVTAAMFGPVISVVGGGIGTIAVVVAAALLWPQVRRIGSLAEVRAEEEVGETGA